MDVTTALKRPFSDWGKLILGSIIGIIPVVNFTMVGYGLQNIKRQKKLPEFTFDSFVLGLKAIGVGIVYGILTLLVMAPFSYNTVSSIVSSVMSGTFNPAMWMSVASTVLIALLIGILTMPLTMSAMLVLGRTQSMKEALDILSVFRYAYRWAIVRYIIIAAIVGFLFSVLLSLIPVLGSIAAGYIVPVFTWTYLGANTPKA